MVINGYEWLLMVINGYKTSNSSDWECDLHPAKAIFPRGHRRADLPIPGWEEAHSTKSV